MRSLLLENSPIDLSNDMKYQLFYLEEIETINPEAGSLLMHEGSISM